MCDVCDNPSTGEYIKIIEVNGSMHLYLCPLSLCVYHTGIYADHYTEYDRYRYDSEPYPKDRLNTLLEMLKNHPR